MRTAIISDLHLGSSSGEDVLRDAAIRRTLLEEIGAADRVVLLGDVVELRGLPLREALAAARPFFEDLGAALGDSEVVLVPGNHDHRFAEALLDRVSVSDAALALENRFAPCPGPSAQIDQWLGDARLELSYPGAWLRDDVYATHGHYMDCHLSLPRAECLAAAAVMRATRPLPDPATPAEYERVLRPIYGLTFGLAQSHARRAAGATGRRPSEAAWQLIGGSHGTSGLRRRMARAVARAGVPAAVWALNRALKSGFEADVSATGISRSGIAGAIETAARLRIEAAHVITGHTHRAGPLDDEEPWAIPGGGRLHNSGCWVFASAFHHPGTPPGPYWPGTVTWLEDSLAPKRVRLLTGHRREELLRQATRR
ncbi:MAG: metallophosphoesterase family protein [Acidimicrobiales bacterium]